MRSIIADCIGKDIQRRYFKSIQKEPNSYGAQGRQRQQRRKDGTLYRNDIPYPSEYPNAFFDLWYADSDVTTPRPTIVYFHGGAFMFGDKADGDPMGENKGKVTSVFPLLMQNRYNLISANYCLAPQYRFPAQIRQTGELLSYLTDYGRALGVDPDHLILMGSSAGANITEICGAALYNRAYAQTIGFPNLIRPEQIRGLVIDEACLDAKSFDERGMILLTQGFTGQRSMKKLVGSVLEAHRYIGDKYPPCFINASNAQHFFIDSARALTRVLDQRKLPYELFYVPRETELLQHGFAAQFETSPSAKECVQRMQRFIRCAMEDESLSQGGK